VSTPNRQFTPIDINLGDVSLTGVDADGVEANLVTFVKSEKQVDKTSWFDFDRLTFETGKATLKPESREQLKNIAEILKAYPGTNIKLGGYTDNTGNASANQKLSADRARSVMNELAGLGIAASRMEAEGYGQEHPVASNDTEEGRAQNRRISILVTKK
jgi:K(+)-stimulated pyrophosphate-energized sodium pump